MPAEFFRTFSPNATDIDELGHVNNAVWVRWVQDIAVAHWSAVATPSMQEQWVWMITRHEIDYRGNVGRGEEVLGKTWISEPPKGARFARHVSFCDAAGRLLVESRTVWALIERARNRPARVTLELAGLFNSGRA